MQKVMTFTSILVMAVLAFVMPANAQAAETLDNNDINKLLTEIAKEKEVPPELAKAIAHMESGWKQWKDDAQTKPNISNDGGIGIMQVTSHICEQGDSSRSSHCFDEEKLKHDIAYNIRAGLDILNEKWDSMGAGNLPVVNFKNRSHIESWYFPVMAYNGIKPVNSPVTRDGKRNQDAYQEKVFARLQAYSMDGQHLVDIPMKKEDFTYERDSDKNITFNKLHYYVDTSLTKSTQTYQEGDLAYVETTKNFKTSPSETSSQRELQEEVVTVLDKETYYDRSADSNGRHWVRYEVKVHTEAGEKTGYVASSVMQRLPYLDRLHGSNRNETAVEISKQGWSKGADAVVLTRNDAYPDALTGAPLAYQEDAPILLTNTESLPTVTKNEIKRLNPDKVFILGGSKNAVSTNVVNQLKQLDSSLTIKRLAGNDRYETAQAIAKEVNNKTDKAVVATGNKFPDALSVAPYAAREGMPILLTKKGSIPQPMKEELTKVEEAVLVGGPGVVNNDVYKQLPGPAVRINGDSRYETASAVAMYSRMNRETAFIATGEDFPDALSGAVLAAKENAPLLLAKENDLTDATRSFIEESPQPTYDFTILGGPNVVGVEDVLAKYSIEYGY
ncbi:cell wall-binding repeat-containing protein [Pontibacillus salicampi]|uniref:Cell wall-binding repeat-containing protein n=1 Tax=Pontibacillus salicampi TaxID=1449801 RepID=A0ABV6LSV2_9BACI